MSHKSVESERRIVSNLRGMPFILRTRQIPHALAPSEPLVTLVSCLGLKGCVVDGHILRGDDCVQRVVIAYFPTPLTERCSRYFFPPSTQKIFQLYGIHNSCKCARKSHGLRTCMASSGVRTLRAVPLNCCPSTRWPLPLLSSQ